MKKSRMFALVLLAFITVLYSTLFDDVDLSNAGFKEILTGKVDCQESYPKAKDMIEVKGFYLGMNICDAQKIMKEGELKEHLHDPQIDLFELGSYNLKRGEAYYLGVCDSPRKNQEPYGCPIGSEELMVLKADIKQKVTSIRFEDKIIKQVFKEEGMSFEKFQDTFFKEYTKGAKPELTKKETGSGEYHKYNLEDAKKGYSVRLWTCVGSACSNVNWNISIFR